MITKDVLEAYLLCILLLVGDGKFCRRRGDPQTWTTFNSSLTLVCGKVDMDDGGDNESHTQTIRWSAERYFVPSTGTSGMLMREISPHGAPFRRVLGWMTRRLSRQELYRHAIFHICLNGSRTKSCARRAPDLPVSVVP